MKLHILANHKALSTKTETITGQCPLDDRRYCGKPDTQPCGRCKTFMAVLTATNANRCHTCGADLAEWRELHGEEHRCC